MGARAWPSGGLCPSPDCLGCGTRFAQTVLAPTEGSGLGRSLARRRPEVAPCDGAGRNAKKEKGGRLGNRSHHHLRIPVIPKPFDCFFQGRLRWGLG